MTNNEMDNIFNEIKEYLDEDSEDLENLDKEKYNDNKSNIIFNTNNGINEFQRNGGNIHILNYINMSYLIREKEYHEKNSIIFDKGAELYNEQNYKKWYEDLKKIFYINYNNGLSYNKEKSEKLSRNIYKILNRLINNKKIKDYNREDDLINYVELYKEKLIYCNTNYFYNVNYIKFWIELYEINKMKYIN